MMLRLILLAAIAAALAVPAAASAGGWATVGLEPPPDGLAPGDTWQAELTVLQHGQTPLEGVHPSVIVAREGKSVAEERVFPARATGEPGVYRATVMFDSAGTWNYRVDDGFAAQHTFKPVRIGAGGKDAATEPVAVANAAAATPPSGGSTASGGDGPDYLLAILAAAVAALAAGGGAALLQRRREGPGPAAG
jgi:hypothetical protein